MKKSQRLGCMHQSYFVPCDCGMCNFCQHRLTDGIVHKKSRGRLYNIIVVHVSTLLYAQMSMSVFLVIGCLTDKYVTGTNQEIRNQMRRRGSAIFQLWVA